MLKALMTSLSLVVLGITLSANVAAQSCSFLQGCLDPTFGTGGIASYALTPNSSAPQSMVVQADGKILATFDAHNIVRLNSDGTLDTTFGSGGVVPFVWAFTSGSTTYYGSASALALQDVDGQQRIVAAGGGHRLSGRKVVGALRVGRFMLDGSVDTSFGTNGSVVINTERANDIKIQADGKILTLSYPATVTRLTSNGSLDVLFGSGGFLNASAGFINDGWHTTNIAVDALGGILVSGDALIGKGSSSRSAISVKRYSSSGIADTAFGISGKATADFGSSVFTGELETDPFGNIVARGRISSSVTSPGYFAAARFTSNGLVDTSFGGTGRVVFLGGVGSRHGLALQPDGKVVMTGRLNDDYGLVRYNYDGTLDADFGNGGSVTTNIDGPDLVMDSVLQMDSFCSCSKIVLGGAAGPSPSNTTFVRFTVD